jgi:hypothetical protein
MIFYYFILIFKGTFKYANGKFFCIYGNFEIYFETVVNGKKFVWFRELRGFENDEEVDILLFLSQFFKALVEWLRYSPSI